MRVRTTACMGMVFLACAAVSSLPGAAAPPGATAADGASVPLVPAARSATPAPMAGAGTVPAPHDAADTSLMGPATPGAAPALRPPPRARTVSHRRFRHIRHHNRASLAVPIGEIRSQIAQTVGLLNQMDENVRNQLTENRADAARLSAAMDGQAHQLGTIDKRVDGIDQRQAAETRSRRQDATLLQTHIAEQGARIDGVEQRIALVAAARANPPLYVAAGLAGLGVLLGIIALVVSYRQRLAAVARAESHVDRLFRTYRAEFEGLVQAARDLEGRLQKTALPSPGPSISLYPASEYSDTQPVAARL